MIKFQPFVAPVFSGYKYVTSTLVFDSIPEAELVEDQNIYMYRMIASYGGQTFKCLFFIDPNSIPQVANVSPSYIAQYGVLMFPEQFEYIVFDYTNVSFSPDVKAAEQAPPPVDELLQELEQAMKEPDIDVSPEMLQLMGEYAKIESDKSVQTAYQCAKIIEHIRSVTQDEFDMLSQLPCGSSKLAAFVLSKLKTKIN
jgi:hypothetical protein